jgi:hypothetical protein
MTRRSVIAAESDDHRKFETRGGDAGTFTDTPTLACVRIHSRLAEFSARSPLRADMRFRENAAPGNTPKLSHESRQEGFRCQTPVD